MITVLMTTHNGASTLPCVLEAFKKLEKPKDGWELVIVDNGSTDQTQEIIQPYCQEMPITIIYEPRKGQNVARNTGLMSVTGDLVVFTDDDVLPQSDWLLQMDTVAKANPTFSVFGGVILPKWKVPVEDWLRDSGWHLLSTCYAIMPPFEEGPIHPGFIWSPNMAFRADIFKAGHYFDTTIGPDGSLNYPMGSETEFVMRLDKLGFKGWHCRQAVVYHIIRPHQLKKEWILSRAIRSGRGRYRIWAKHTLNSPLSVRVPKYLMSQAKIWVRILIQTARLAVAKWRGDTNKVFKERWLWNFHFGKAVESWKMGIKRQALIN